MITLRVEGAPKILSEFKKLGKLYPKAAAAALYRLGVAILANSLPRTPVEFGALRASAYVSPPQGTTIADLEVGYGTEYAVPQHERLDYRHPNGGEAKFLEKGMRAVLPGALPKLAKWTMDSVKSGGSYGQAAGVKTRPPSSKSKGSTKSGKTRLKRAAANVRKRTGR